MLYLDDLQTKAYPLVPAFGAALPHDLIADVALQAPDSLGTVPQILSCSVTNMLVSLLFGIDGALVGSLTVLQSSVEPGMPLDITPTVQGVAGYCCLGRGVAEHRLRVDGPLDLAQQVLFRYPAPVQQGTLQVLGQWLDLPVQLLTDSNLAITRETLEVYDETTGVSSARDCLVISATSQQALEGPVGACQRRADGVLGRQPLRSLAGVPPDPTGALWIQVYSAQDSTIQPGFEVERVDAGLVIRDASVPCSNGLVDVIPRHGFGLVWTGDGIMDPSNGTFDDTASFPMGKTENWTFDGIPAGQHTRVGAFLSVPRSGWYVFNVTGDGANSFALKPTEMGTLEVLALSSGTTQTQSTPIWLERDTQFWAVSRHGGSANPGWGQALWSYWGSGPTAIQQTGYTVIDGYFMAKP